MTDPKLTVHSTVYRAWWEDHDGWDGALTYADVDTAKAHAAIDYASEENVPEEEIGGLRWEAVGETWALFDRDERTPVDVYPERVYGPATT